MHCTAKYSKGLHGGKRSHRRSNKPMRRSCKKKSHRRCKKRRKQRGGACGPCTQSGGGALVNAIVPTVLLTALYKLTKKNKHRPKRVRRTRRR
tara:strand:+ start:1344 stop:1622 length:279 start_codon:yes stop_codon:yes gene_type:complete